MTEKPVQQDKQWSPQPFHRKELMKQVFSMMMGLGGGLLVPTLDMHQCTGQGRPGTDCCKHGSVALSRMALHELT